MIYFFKCVAIRFYGTRAKQFNQVWVALVVSALSWAFGLALAFLGTFPAPVVAILPALWTVGMREEGTRREALLTYTSLAILGFSVSLQWICSSLVLHKIFVVRKKILSNKLGLDSANRFRKQARLTFQFLYPSLFCAASSALQFAKPFLHRHFRLVNPSLIALHLIWLLNHACNPVIYAYFNERMRASYIELFTCVYVRSRIRRRKRKYFDNPLGMTWTMRLCAFAGLPLARFRRPMKRRPQSRTGTSSTAGGRRANGNFVRSSLQMQSRDFEQLCEFMMRVNPPNDSSEGWHESATPSSSPSSSSSGEEEGFWPGRKVRSEGGLLSAVEAIRRLSNQSISIAQQPTREASHSIVLLNLGRTLGTRFSNKGSI
uniref:G-protein coupled receptors family 1 profile domain-containing protein n=1 Tax=Globodera rostochiensis TaxID=31243 RepID=A0A914GSB0_GLORO